MRHQGTGQDACIKPLTVTKAGEKPETKGGKARNKNCVFPTQLTNTQTALRKQGDRVEKHTTPCLRNTGVCQNCNSILC
jgi:hypothetical protein